MTAALLALLSSAMWGSADYVGGVLSRRRAALQIAAGSQAIALVVVWAAMLLSGTGITGDAVRWGLLAGGCGGLAVMAFYAALAAGTMGVVAPISALGLIVPVVAGLLAGERPGGLQLLGIAVAVVGVVLASGPELSGGASPRPLLFAALAGLGFGLTLLLLAQTDDTLPTLAMMRVSSVSLLGAILLVSLRRTPGRRIGVRELPALAFVGLGDLGANGLFVLASASGLLSVVAVLSSLYPAVTVLLAWRFGRERLRRIQVTGVATALVGVVLLAAG